MSLYIKTYLTLLTIWFSLNSACAHSKGVEFVSLLSYHSNVDVEAKVEENRSKIDKRRKGSALSRVIAKSNITNNVRRQHKKEENKRLLGGLHDGESRQYMKLDADNNRMAVFSPQHGRVIMTDWKNGKMIIAYPKLKMAVNYTVDVMVAKQAGSMDVNELLETDTIPEGAEIEEINGYVAMQPFAYRDVEPGTMPENTVMIKGKLKEVFPMPGYVLVKNEHEYYKSLYVEGVNNNAKETIESRLEMFRETAINNSNFILPENYKLLTTQKEIDNKLTPILQKGKQIMEDPGEMPDVFW